MTLPIVIRIGLHCIAGQELGLRSYPIVTLTHTKAHYECGLLQSASLRVFHLVLRILHVHAHGGWSLHVHTHDRLEVTSLSSCWVSTHRRWHHWWRNEVTANRVDLLNILMHHPGVSYWESNFDRFTGCIRFLICKANEFIVRIKTCISGLLLLMTRGHQIPSSDCVLSLQLVYRLLSINSDMIPVSLTLTFFFFFKFNFSLAAVALFLDFVPFAEANDEATAAGNAYEGREVRLLRRALSRVDAVVIREVVSTVLLTTIVIVIVVQSSHIGIVA